MLMRKPLRKLFICLFVGGLGFNWWFSDILIGQRPRIPSREFYIAFPAHGETTYISLLDQRAYTGSWILMAISFVVYGLLYIADTTAKKKKSEFDNGRQQRRF